VISPQWELMILIHRREEVIEHAPRAVPGTR
jgi:hypothetical protein